MIVDDFFYWHCYGYSQREVADFLDLHYAAVSRMANRP
jgi:predicted transcriptional regulator